MIGLEGPNNIIPIDGVWALEPSYLSPWTLMDNLA